MTEQKNGWDELERKWGFFGAIAISTGKFVLSAIGFVVFLGFALLAVGFVFGLAGGIYSWATTEESVAADAANEEDLKVAQKRLDEDMTRKAEAIKAEAERRAAEATEAARREREEALRPRYKVVDVRTDETCMQIGDYCVSVHCTYQNVGQAAAEVTATGRLYETDASRPTDERGEPIGTEVAARTERLTLMPNGVKRLTFNFQEAVLDKKYFGECLVSAR